MKASVGFAGLLIFISVFSDFISPCHPSTQDLNQFYSPPARLRLFDNRGKLHGKPFIYETELANPLDVTYREISETCYPVNFFFRGYRYKLFGLIETDRHLLGRSDSPVYHPMGTDELGRDVLARVLAGSRTSLMVVIFGMFVYAVLGLTIGTLAGFLGGWMDSLLMRFSELILALPALYLVLALRTIMPVRIPFWQCLFLTIGIIAAVAWPPMARGVRGLILQLRSAVYVEAARSLGGTPFHIFRRHILPSLIPFVFAQTAVAAPIFLLGEVTLSFLDVGFRGSGESWGSMLRSLRDPRVVTDFWWNLLPLCMVFLTLLCLNKFSGRLRSGELGNQVSRL